MEKMLAAAGYSEKAIRYYIEKPYMGSIPDADQISEMTGTGHVRGHHENLAEGGKRRDPGCPL